MHPSSITSLYWIGPFLARLSPFACHGNCIIIIKVVQDQYSPFDDLGVCAADISHVSTSHLFAISFFYHIPLAISIHHNSPHTVVWASLRRWRWDLLVARLFFFIFNQSPTNPEISHFSFALSTPTIDSLHHHLILRVFLSSSSAAADSALTIVEKRRDLQNQILTITTWLRKRRRWTDPKGRSGRPKSNSNNEEAPKRTRSNNKTTTHLSD